MIREINIWLDVRKVTNDSRCEVACEHYYSPSYDVLWGGGEFRHYKPALELGCEACGWGKKLTKHNVRQIRELNGGKVMSIMGSCLPK